MKVQLVHQSSYYDPLQGNFHFLQSFSINQKLLQRVISGQLNETGLLKFLRPSEEHPRGHQKMDERLITDPLWKIGTYSFVVA